MDRQKKAGSRVPGGSQCLEDGFPAYDDPAWAPASLLLIIISIAVVLDKGEAAIAPEWSELFIVAGMFLTDRTDRNSFGEVPLGR
jgi:hypothetical protein